MSLLLLFLCAHAPYADDAATQATIATARELIDQGKSEEAEQTLLEAMKANPSATPIFLTLAELFEAGDRKEEAMELYGYVLTKINPKQQKAADRFHRLFYEGRFPRELRLRHLGLGGVACNVDTCRLAGEFHAGSEDLRRFAYTTSLIFPEEMSRGHSAPWIRLPPAGGAPANLMYNRVCYGMIADPGSDVVRARWLLGYPSPTIILSEADYSDLAGHLMHLLLRAHVYVQEYLGLDRRRQEGGLLRTFLTEEGPTGAEQLGDSIYFYDADHDREPLEWLREVFHEAGHLFLPRVGPFEGEERWGNGDLGERLLLQWLLEEAGTVAGSPWPSAAAREAFDKLWRPCHAEAERYLREKCRIPMNAWLATPPESFEGEDAIERFAGFCLWAQAAHGRALLAGILHNSEGATPADFMVAYKNVVTRLLAKGSPLWVDAGSLRPVRSRLAQPPGEGAIRRELIALSQGGHAALRVYLPAGRWTLTPAVDRETKPKLEIALDGAEALDCEGNTPLDLPELAEGWREIVVSCLSPGPVELVGLRVVGGQGLGIRD